jgi:hypothetical protein
MIGRPRLLTPSGNEGIRAGIAPIPDAGEVSHHAPHRHVQSAARIARARMHLGGFLRRFSSGRARRLEHLRFPGVGAVAAV